MSITAANATYFLGVTGLFSIPQQLQGFAADDIFSTEAIDTAELQMGVDGTLSAGFVFVPVKQSITLQADSASNAIFDAWRAAEVAAQEKFAATGIVVLTSIGSKWALVNGYLTSFPPIPDAGKTLKPRKYQITWQSVSPAVVL